MLPINTSLTVPPTPNTLETRPMTTKPYDYATANDVTCRIAKNTEYRTRQPWAVFVGDRKEPALRFRLKRDAKAYVERRATLDEAQARYLRDLDCKKSSRFSPPPTCPGTTRLEAVAGMAVKAYERRYARDGRIVWEIWLDCAAIGFVTELGGSSYCYIPFFEENPYLSGTVYNAWGSLEEAAKILCHAHLRALHFNYLNR